MSEEARELGVRVALDRANHVRRDEPREHRFIEEHLPSESLAVAALATAGLEHVPSTIEARGVRGYVYGRSGDVELLAKAVLASCVDDDENDADDRDDRDAGPFEYAFHSERRTGSRLECSHSFRRASAPRGILRSNGSGLVEDHAVPLERIGNRLAELGRRAN